MPPPSTYRRMVGVTSDSRIGRQSGRGRHQRTRPKGCRRQPPPLGVSDSQCGSGTGTPPGGRDQHHAVGLPASLGLRIPSEDRADVLRVRQMDIRVRQMDIGAEPGQWEGDAVPAAAATRPQEAERAEGEVHGLHPGRYRPPALAPPRRLPAHPSYRGRRGACGFTMSGAWSGTILGLPVAGVQALPRRRDPGDLWSGILRPRAGPSRGRRRGCRGTRRSRRPGVRE